MSDVLHDLSALLETEREALGSGRLDDLAPLAARKEALLTRLEAEVAVRADLAPLTGALERNARLLERAMDGVRDAGRRVEALRLAQRSLRTYDAQGQSTEVFRSGRGLSRKA